jgi:hypothetical protein
MESVPCGFAACQHSTDSCIKCVCEWVSVCVCVCVFVCVCVCVHKYIYDSVPCGCAACQHSTDSLVNIIGRNVHMVYIDLVCLDWSVWIAGPSIYLYTISIFQANILHPYLLYLLLRCAPPLCDDRVILKSQRPNIFIIYSPSIIFICSIFIIR